MVRFAKNNDLQEFPNFKAVIGKAVAEITIMKIAVKWQGKYFKLC
jgi:hypothetical protein